MLGELLSKSELRHFNTNTDVRQACATSAKLQIDRITFVASESIDYHYTVL